MAVSKKVRYIQFGLLTLVSSCLVSVDESHNSQSNAKSFSESTEIPSKLNRILDSHGRPTFDFLNKKRVDLSSVLSNFQGQKIKKFSIIDPNGEVYFEAIGGLPEWNTFSLPTKSKPHTLKIETDDGRFFKKLL